MNAAIAWLLIVAVDDRPPVITQIGPFSSEAACEAAKAKLEKPLRVRSAVCVPTDIP
jgi:hypothetical protein